MVYFHVHLLQCVSSTSLETSTVTDGLFRSVLVSKCLEFFLSSEVIDFKLGFIVVREHTLHDFNYFKFVEVCFMAQDMVYLSICTMDTWKHFVFCCCWMKCSINVSSKACQVEFLLGSSMFWLTFCLTFSINYCKRGLEVTNHNGEIVYSPFSSISFSLPYL